jgi:hypothetical protein
MYVYFSSTFQYTFLCTLFFYYLFRSTKYLFYTFIQTLSNKSFFSLFFNTSESRKSTFIGFTLFLGVLLLFMLVLRGL